jgi:DNA-binding IclR family transcriptional regulator
MRNTVIDKTPGGVGLLNKAFHVLDQFTTDQPTWTQADLGRATGVSKSTVNRLVRYFCTRGYLTRLEGQGRYGLGPAAVDLGTRASAQFDLGGAALPLLERLMRETDETSLLASYRPGQSEVVCVAQIASPREGLRVFQSIGSAIPLHAGAVAKAVLAFLPDEVRTAVVEGPLVRLTEKTITDPAVLAHDLDEIKARGHAISREETYPGVYGIGAPVFGPGGAIAGGIAIAAPSFRMEAATMLDHVKRVVAVAEALSDRLGSPGPAK